LVCTNPQIAAGTGISLVTVIKIINILISEKKVIEQGTLDSTGGRKAKSYHWNPNAEHSIGLYYMEGMIYGFVIDALGNIIFHKNTSFLESDHIVTITCNAINELMKADTEGKISVIGLGIPGVVNQQSISSVFSIPQLNGYPFIQKLEDQFNLPVLIENDINLAAMGFYLNQTNNNAQDIQLLYMEEGVGSGIILNGKLFRGKTSFAGEIGYLPMEIGNGKTRTLEETIRDFRSKIKLYPMDSSYRKVLNRVIAKAMVSSICILNPETIAITGDFSPEDIQEITQELHQMLVIENMPKIEVIQDLHKYCVCGIVNLCIDYLKSGNVHIKKSEKNKYE
jgi:predicted NBD/HSP70 family sugar kinase